MTDADGNITDTFAYDTYGKLISRTGTSTIIFGYNGRDGVITEANGLIYMRARYYSPDMRRFVNADIVAGKLSKAVTLNRFAYANGNPVSFVDPFGLEDSRDGDYEEIVYGDSEYYSVLAAFLSDALDLKDDVDAIRTYIKALELENAGVRFVKSGKFYYIFGDTKVLNKYKITKNRIYTHKIGKYAGIANLADPSTILKSGLKSAFDAPGVLLDAVEIAAATVYEVSQYDSEEDKWAIGLYTVVTETVSSVASTVATVSTTAAITKMTVTAGTAIAPGIGTLVGLAAGLIVGAALDAASSWFKKEHVEGWLENN